MSAELGGRLSSPELVLWTRADFLDSRCRSFDPRVPGSRPGRPTRNDRLNPDSLLAVDAVDAGAEERR